MRMYQRHSDPRRQDLDGKADFHTSLQIQPAGNMGMLLARRPMTLIQYVLVREVKDSRGHCAHALVDVGQVS